MNNLSHDQEAPPCRHMESLLSELASGQLTGLRRTVAVWHISKCTRCGTFHERLKLTLAALAASKDQSASGDQAALDRLKAKLAELNS